MKVISIKFLYHPEIPNICTKMPNFQQVVWKVSTVLKINLPESLWNPVFRHQMFQSYKLAFVQCGPEDTIEGKCTSVVRWCFTCRVLQKSFPKTFDHVFCNKRDSGQRMVNQTISCFEISISNSWFHTICSCSLHVVQITQNLTFITSMLCSTESCQNHCQKGDGRFSG